MVGLVLSVLVVWIGGVGSGAGGCCGFGVPVLVDAVHGSAGKLGFVGPSLDVVRTRGVDDPDLGVGVAQGEAVRDGEFRIAPRCELDRELHAVLVDPLAVKQE